MSNINLNDLEISQALDGKAMAAIKGGFKIFGWGGTIGNKRRRIRKPRSTHRARDYRGGTVRTHVARDYRKPRWPIVE